MLTLIPSPAAFIRIRASGRLTAADYRRFEPVFTADLERRNLPISLLLDMRGFRGWTPAGLLRDLRWDVRNRRTFSRIAVIGDRRWHRWITVAGVPLFRAPLKFFRPGEEQLAAEWLGQAEAPSGE
jgi:hypothetical protein